MISSIATTTIVLGAMSTPLQKLYIKKLNRSYRVIKTHKRE